jgi:hypothetical protein
MNPSAGQGERQGHSGGGSVGTLVVVLAVITILGVLAGVIARICGGRHLAGHGDYDFEGWVENKCSSCIDGSLGGGPGSCNASGDGPAQAPPKDGGDATSKAAAEEAKMAGSDEKKEGDGGEG